ncbi:hypothetical protein [Mucilaginibacter segetis]|uniref:Uncharacterized protein n=1 Tax=Mucilaginibacter segetis TaxID=2793071 RepID=A0A934PT36_9SPHI|nr:hypothetical protein [Mucilaginibacter segetis]MBK0378478.1 hypothetical protein [Mucilaginibacter segetis]
METHFYIWLSLRTGRGFVNYAQYFLGDDREAATSLFEKLKGNKNDLIPLHLDLMETADDLPVKIKSICCSLDELGENCKLISRELFRISNLEDMT